MHGLRAPDDRPAGSRMDPLTRPAAPKSAPNPPPKNNPVTTFAKLLSPFPSITYKHHAPVTRHPPCYPVSGTGRPAPRVRLSFSFMATIQQIEANRLNAQKSTGPCSVAGKAVSRFNATKTGIDAKSQIIRSEDPADLETLAAEYQERWQPATPEERLLVDTLIHDEWLLRRFRRIDAEILECEMQDAWNPKSDCPAGQAFSRGQTAFSRLQRRIDSTERSYHRALETLGFLRQDPDPTPPPPDPDPVALSTPPPAPDVTPSPSAPPPQIGFVPQSSPPPAPGPWPPAPEVPCASIKPEWRSRI